MVSEVTVQKNSKQTHRLVEKVIVQKLVEGFCAVTSNHKVLGIRRPSVLNQKHSMGWFLLIRFDLLRVFSLHIILFLLINLQKTRTYLK